jgi:type II secretory pathway component PulF
VQTFRYEAKGTSGDIVRGSVEAETERGAVERIREMGYWVLRVKGERARPAVTWYQNLARGYFSFILHRVNTKSRAIWYRSFSSLLGAGINVHEAALTLAERTRNRTLRQVAREIADAAARGRPMSPVLERYASTFPLFARALVETGEETGLLNETMEQLAAFYDSMYELEMAFRIETFYPKIVLFMFIIIPPIIPAVAGSSGAGRLVFDWHVYLQAILDSIGWWVVALVGFWFLWRLLMQAPPLHQGWDRAKLLIPWIGGIVRRTALVRWARAMAMLIRAGVPLRRALAAAAAATGNEAMAASLQRELPRVMSGESLSAVMALSREFPEQAIDMVATGERTGEIDKMLDKLADYLHAEATTSGKQTAVIAGVAFYLLVAAMVGMFVISFWISYYSGFGDLLSGAGEGF